MTKKRYGARLIEAMKEAVAIDRGEATAPRVHRTVLTARHAAAEPPGGYTRERIVDLRTQLHLSQPVFAQALNVSANTVRAWEQGRRVPDGAALRLLQLVDEHPQWILQTVRKDGAPSGEAPSSQARRRHDRA
jgi:putative transcriptional regulator